MRLPKPKIGREVALQMWTEKQSEYAMEQVILNNVGLIDLNLRKLNMNPADEDLISIGMIGLIRAVKGFRTEKNIMFSTYASKAIRNEILNAFRKKRIIPACSLDEPCKNSGQEYGKELKLEDVIPDWKNLEEEITYKVHFSSMMSQLNERDKKIVILLLHGEKQRNISRIVGTSQSNVSRILKKIKKME